MKQLLDRADKHDSPRTTSTSKRGTYERFTAEEKAKIGRRAAEHGVTASVHYFSKVFPGRSLKESSVQTWKTKYLQKITAKRRVGEEATVKELAHKKTGRPLLLGENLDKQVRAYLGSYEKTEQSLTQR